MIYYGGGSYCTPSRACYFGGGYYPGYVAYYPYVYGWGFGRGAYYHRYWRGGGWGNSYYRRGWGRGWHRHHWLEARMTKPRSRTAQQTFGATGLFNSAFHRYFFFSRVSALSRCGYRLHRSSSKWATGIS
jgi:hypothetical protein